ncbi:MAG: DUF2510 domain-containing protein [Actinobacteria bacterium]|nr:DUF2510 domain-containing protein [Actinomycetota bacterium]
MTAMNETPSGWYADPTARHEQRYFDGTTWTDHVSSNGVQSTDAMQRSLSDSIDRALTVDSAPNPDRIRAQVAKSDQRSGAAGAGWTGPGGLFGEPVLVVNQKAKLIEVNSQYAVFDQHGQQIAAVNQVGQSAVKKALRVLTSLDQFMTHRLDITDATGQLVLRLTRPGKVFKSTVVVSDPSDREVGRIVQENMFGKIRFGFIVDGQRIGSINAQNWRAWDFAIHDETETEIARVTKTWEGLAKTMFTTADNYVLRVHRPDLPQPLLSLVVASALSIDTALKQDSRGLG